MKLTLPGQLELPATDERPGELAAMRSSRPIKPAVPQQPLNFGLFGDDSLQTDLIEMLMEPYPD